MGKRCEVHNATKKETAQIMSDNGVLEGIALFAAMGKALDEVGDVITDYIIPDSKVLAEDAMDRVIAAVDNVKLVSQMRGHNVPEPIKVQAQTIIKHKPPPEGASMEVSGAWFKMAQNIARWCAEGAQDAELADHFRFEYDASPFNDVGPKERGERNDHD